MKLWHIPILLVFISGCALAVAIREKLGLEEDEPAATGVASWYGEGYRGKRMANGRRYNPDLLTCATWEWPIGAWLEVEHAGKRVLVQVTDRGPALTLGRLIDLSQAAFAKLADLKRGVLTVHVRRVPPPTLPIN